MPVQQLWNQEHGLRELLTTAADGLEGSAPSDRITTTLSLYASMAGDKAKALRMASMAEYRTVCVDSDCFDLTAFRASDATNMLPVPANSSLDYTDDRAEKIQEALNHLRATFPAGYATFRSYVRLISWLNSSGDSAGTTFTSASFPGFPLWIFLSDRADVHLAPNTVSTNPSKRILADNLYHEAIHQAVNVQLLFGSILDASYDARTAPAIDIPWRIEAEEKNRRWQLDRVLHACVVYESLLAYRRIQLADVSLSDDERSSISEAALAAINSFEFLSNALLDHLRYFTIEGQQLIRILEGIARHAKHGDNQKIVRSVAGF